MMKNKGLGTINKSIPIPSWYNGNIDLNNRQVYVDPETKQIQTEYSIGVAFDPGDQYSIRLPQIINGKPVSKNQAIHNFFKTGEHLGVTHREFGESIKDFYDRVNKLDHQLHERQEKVYSNGMK